MRVIFIFRGLSLQAAVQVPSADPSAANRKDTVGPVQWHEVLVVTDSQERGGDPFG